MINADVRPITDRAKTALFDFLEPYVAGCRFLDLFAGTGQVGIEALSRRAKEAAFVERNPAALQTIQENLEHTELTERARVIKADVFKLLDQRPEPFDFIFIAPPQYQGLWAKTLHQLDEHMGWLESDGWVIVQINPKEYEDLALENLLLFEQRTYSGVMLCFYARKENVFGEEEE